MGPIAELVQTKEKNYCVICGSETEEQRESIMYECERCMNTHVE
jgi:ribosomal protein L37AE/L43A